MSDPLIPTVADARSPSSPIPAAPRLNGLFVLSAVCMIFGLFALNGSLDFSPLPAHNLLVLIGVLNVYEAATLAIALLLHRRGLAIDARTLVVIEGLFLFDGAFLTSELITVMPTVGRPIAAALVLAGLLKLWAVLQVAGGTRLISRTGALAVALMLFLALIPTSIRAVADAHAGTLTPLGYHAAWWIAAGALVVGAALWRRDDHPVVHAIIGIAMASVLAHVATAGWVNKMSYTTVDVAPVVLGASLLVGQARLFALPRDTAARIELLLPIVAVLMAARTSAEMSFDRWGIALTPLRLALLGAIGIYVHGLVRHRDPAFGVLLVGGSLVAVAGHTTRTIGMTATDVLHLLGDTIRRMIPRTLVQWGWISVTAAFALLAGGAHSSMRRSRVE